MVEAKYEIISCARGGGGGGDYGRLKSELVYVS